MTELRAGKAFADALFDLAQPQEGLAEKIDTVLAGLAAALAANPQWRRIQRDPLFAARRAQIADELFAPMKFPPLLRRFLLILARRGGLDSLGDISAQFSARCQAREGAVEVEALAAQQLAENQKKELTQLARRIFGPGASLSWQIDPGLMAGFILRSPARCFDASLAGKLRGLARALDLPASGG